MTARSRRSLYRSLAMSIVAAGATVALNYWRRSCVHKVADKKLDDRLEDSFPASDAVAKY